MIKACSSTCGRSRGRSRTKGPRWIGKNGVDCLITTLIKNLRMNLIGNKNLQGLMQIWNEKVRIIKIMCSRETEKLDDLKNQSNLEMPGNGVKRCSV